ncbi:MAG: ABC transporter permease [Kofleriaceae bacterium]
MLGSTAPLPSARRELTAAMIALLVSVAIGSVLMMLVGKAPGHVWWLMITRTLGDEYLVGQLLYKATALAFPAIAVAIALDAGMFNIGAEGQLTAGVLACAIVGASLPEATPAVFAVPLCLLAAAGAGGAVGAAIGALRVVREANEVITSIMFNAIVAGLALWIGNEWLFQGGTTRGPAIVQSAQLPALGFGGSAVNASLFLVVLVIAGAWWLRSRSTWGQAWRAVGRDPATAHAVGIDVARVRILVMTASGALAGLAASNFVLGHKHAFEEGLGRGTGFLGVAAALLGRQHPVGIGVAALALGFLSSGGLAVADTVPKELTEVLMGVVVLAIAGSAAWVRDAKTATKADPRESA